MSDPPPDRLSTPAPEDLRRLCVAVAREAGAFARDARRSLGAGRRVAHDTKSSDVDPVTEFDRETEALVVERLIGARPHDAIVGEEGADRTGSTGLEWHVDPIDGTVNFVYDIPLWCTSIAVVRDGVPVAGAICAPLLGETYSAAAGRGAWLTGEDGTLDQRLATSTASHLPTSLVATGFSYHVGEHRVHQAERIARLLPEVRDIRRSGSAALDLAFLAAGRVEGYFEEFLNSWDLAAGALLVTEASGVVTAFDGTALDVTAPEGIVAAGSSIHDALLGRIHDA